ncbi:MAG: DUF2235 domain-containing protein [Hyphomonadaceae bacterium]
MKRLCIFMDGTWQNLYQLVPTNIARLAESVAHSDKDGVEQLIYYDKGVGAGAVASKSWSNHVISGVTGAGLEDTLLNAYLFLCWNYVPGDQIYIFGFSRGAFTARSLCGLIRNAGSLHRVNADQARGAFQLYRERQHPDVEKAQQFRKDYSHDPVPITYLGVFDTVGQRGVPSNFGPLANLWNRRWQFHDTKLSSLVRAARHACALDEVRGVFPVTPWENLDERNAEQGFSPADPKAPYQQRWFPGSHGEIGGGVDSKLPNIAMQWIAEGAARAGLSFTAEKCPLATSLLPENLDPYYALLPNTGLLSMGFKSYRKLKAYTRKVKPDAADVSLYLSDAALARWRSGDMSPPYRPKSLKKLAKLIDDLHEQAAKKTDA